MLKRCYRLLEKSDGPILAYPDRLPFERFGFIFILKNKDTFERKPMDGKSD